MCSSFLLTKLQANDFSVNMAFPSGISVVIATEGRGCLTANLLKKLFAARRSFEYPTEVLVVDSSSGQERLEIADACKNYDAVLIDGPSSVRKKRNIGIGLVKYSILLFLDSDCIPSDDLLVRHWQHYDVQAGNRVGGVLGRLEFVGKETFSWKLIRESSLVQHFSVASHAKSVRWGATANLSVSREVLDEVGMFDESFPFKLGGDDLDLTYRMTHAGWELLCDPNALVFHDRSTWASIKSVLSRALRWGKMEYYLYCKHPDLRCASTPTIWGWTIFVLVYAVVLSVLQSSTVFLLFPLVWFVLSLILFSVWIAMSVHESASTRAKTFGQSLLTAVPELTYQLGSTLEFLAHGDFRFLYSRALLSHQGIAGYWTADAWNVWSNLVSLLICQTVFWTWSLRL
jgi:hypothetical protein